MHGAFLYVAYTSLYGDVPLSVCVLANFLKIFFGGLLFRAGF